MPMGTRNNPAEDSNQGDDSAGDQVLLVGQQTADDDIDELWLRLLKRPYFKNASIERQEEIYDREREIERKEREREMNIVIERERREHELRLRELVHETPAAPVSVNNSESHFPRVCLPDWSDSTKPEVYFGTVEKLLESSGIPKSLWVGQIVHKLTDKAQKVYARLSINEANDYPTLRKAILDEYKVNPIVNRKNFFQWSKRPSQTYKEYIKILKEQMDAWVGETDHSRVDWPELLLKYRLESQLTDELCLFLLDKNVSSVEECAEMADAFTLNRKIVSKTSSANSQHSRSKPPSGPPSVTKATVNNNNNNNGTVNSRPINSDSHSSAFPTRPANAPKYCTYCQRRGHWRVDCFVDPESPKFKGRRVQTTGDGAYNTSNSNTSQQTTAFASECHSLIESPEVIDPLLSKYTGTAYIKAAHPALSFPCTYLRDSGSTCSILYKDSIPNNQLQYTGENVTLRGINMSAGTYPIANVEVKSDLYNGPLRVIVTSHRPVSGISLILGNDIIAPQDEMKMYCAVITRARSKEIAQEIDSSHLFDSNDSTDSGDKGDNEMISDEEPEEPSSSQRNVDESEHETNRDCSISDFSCNIDPNELLSEQEKDNTLLPLWEMADKESADSAGYYIKEAPRVLMRRERPEGRDREKPWKSRDQIIVPVKYRTDVMKIAHEHPTAAHQGFKKTLARLKQKFFWPGIRRDVKIHCRACGPCQRLGRGEKASIAPLKTLPIIQKPFEFISADFVGPLSKTPSGNRYILNIIDHATKYVESYPLPSANSEYTVKAFTDLFSRHGTPTKLLTDRGSTFVGEVFETFLSDLGVHHLCSSPYHPQTNGAVERTNGVIKNMLKLVMSENREPWDQVLPWILFAYRSAVHSTTGFSPFYLLYGRDPPGPLDAVYNRWTGSDSDDALPVNSYIHGLCLRTHGALEEAYVNARDKATERKNYYDSKRKVKAVEYKPRDAVLVHLPLIGKAMKGAWQGPYQILEKTGTHTYIVNMPDKRIKRRTFHVNAIKPWTPRVPVVALAVQPEVLPPTVGEQLEGLCEPTPLELASDPSDYTASSCQPNGSWPDISHLSADCQEQLRQLFDKYACLFSGKLGRFKGVEHDIDVGDHRPIKQHFYRTSPEKLKILRNEIDAMLQMGVIRPSSSEWCSPMILVKKPNNEWRPVIDFRKLNAVSRGDSYPLPRLDDLVDKAGSAKFISCLDISKGYWQVPLTDRAKDIAAFITPFGCFSPEVMPFGLKSASSTFQRVMDNTLTGLEQISDAYQDDIAVQSLTWLFHLTHLEQVFMRLADLGVTLNAKKCKIALPNVSYLGHQLGSGRIRPVPSKVESILNMPPPSTIKQLRGFLGVVGFYRRFIPRYSDISAPLTDLLRGGAKGSLSSVWHPACDSAFTELKASLARGPVLKAPDFTQPYEMYCDASDCGIASVLTQLEDDTPKPVSYFSRKLLPREQNYSVVEKELLALVAGLHAFRAYVGHGPLTIHTDHHPLAWLKQTRTSNQRILRWALFLSEYDLIINHIKGKDNIVADLLSRQIA